ncbi:hypothetical protein EW026_g1393 [Hermanssonia centrifuga]|uniref:4-hydroxybenzoate octaprenyltransferase n=1 Tax=Hermanssonia centrifuga TaxID=98765 RepID=A0A4S4KRN5_9APHY|nr:hypothetical protein EW026_g1393 [Hermanssonia centrifuga]
MLASCWCWTMQYDTIYACQDRKDDIKIGVHSTAVLFGTHVRPFIQASAIGFVVLLVCAGIANQQSPLYFLFSCAGTAFWFIRQFRDLDLDEPKSCWAAFKGNGKLGWFVWSGLIIDYIWKLQNLQVALL